MTTWIVLGSILLLLILVGRLPVGVDAAWSEGRFSLAAKLWFLSVRLGTRTKEKTGDKKPSEKKESSQKKKRLPAALIKILIQNGYHTLCRLVARLRVEILRLHFTAAGADPAVTAMTYAAAGTCMDALVHIGGPRIAHPDLQAMVDFDGETPTVDFRIVLLIRVYQVLSAALCFGFGFLKDYFCYKKEDAQHGKSDR